jgi:hypothetical protein
MPSIYRPKDSTVAPQAEASRGAQINTDAHSPGNETSDEQSRWAGRRKAQPANLLLPATRSWLDSLPAAYRPGALAEQFPRLANLIAVNWNNPGDCTAFISSLLMDQRGGRRGFPDEVLGDILNLRVYYAGLHPIIDWGGDVQSDTHRRHWAPSTTKR